VDEISDFKDARKCAPITLIYQTTEDNLDGSPWPPDGNDHWCIVNRANGQTKWRLIRISPLRAPIVAANGPRPLWRHSTKGMKQ
jgi:hypothetical protein